MVDAYTHSSEHLADHLDRLRTLLKIYMRRFPERLVGGPTYTDQGVGRDEIRTHLQLPFERAEPQSFLDALGVPPLDVLNAELDQHEIRIATRLEHTMREHPEVTLPIEELRGNFQLTPVELDLLLAIAAPRLSFAFSRLYPVAWTDFSIKQPTLAFICSLVAAQDGREMEPLEALFMKQAPLVRHRLVVLHEHGRWVPETPRLHAAVSIPQRILDAIRFPEAKQQPLLGTHLHTQPLSTDALVIEDTTRTAIIQALRRRPPRLLLTGPRGSGRRTVVLSLTRPPGGLLEVSLEQILSSDMQETREDALYERFAELLREALLLRAHLLIRLDALEKDPIARVRRESARLSALLAQFSGVVVFTESDSATLLASTLSPNLSHVIFRAPPREGQRMLWRSALEGRTTKEPLPTLIDALSAVYRLTPGDIHHIAQSLTTGRRKARLTRNQLLHAVRLRLDHQLSWLAEPISVGMELEEMILTDRAREQLLSIVTFARNAERVFDDWEFARKSPGGRGLSVMFSGPPGTGKSLAAGILAKMLDRVVYKVDLSRIVDKYIGETEKNLSRVFTEAERGQAILLFDEADSLFARRTDVRSSNDRYANLEVNFLLQKLESFSGVSILTTNFESSIDEAFKRRIRFHVDFPMPEPDMRAQLWQTLLPPGAPLAKEIDWTRLGKAFNLSGGHIKNAVLRAAVVAAEQGSPIREELLFQAGQEESRELGLLVSN